MPSQYAYIQVPFANGGDRSAVPVAQDPNGAVSWTQGYGPDYQRDLTTDPNAKSIQRDSMNQLFYALSLSVKAWQESGYPEWVPAADSGGTQLAYGAGVVVVRINTTTGERVLWTSLVANNKATPGDSTNQWLQTPFRTASAAEISAQAGAMPPTLTQVVALIPLLAPSPSQATESNQGVIALATTGEVADGVDDAKAVTSAKLAAQFSAKVRNATTSIKGVVALATGTEAVAGENAEKAVSPAALASAISAYSGVLAVKGLRISTTGADAKVTITCAEVSVRASNGFARLLSGVSLTANTAAAGLNGIDSGSLVASTWYSVWLIFNPTSGAVASILSASADAPTLPSGYTFKNRIGWIRTDATANKYPLSLIQSGRKSRYLVGASKNVTSQPVMASGLSGSVNAPTYVAVPVGAFVPPTATFISVRLGTNGQNSSAICAPNNSYSAPADAPMFMNAGTSIDLTASSLNMDMLLETNNIYWASSNAGCNLRCVGWEDDI